MGLNIGRIACGLAAAHLASTTDNLVQLCLHRASFSSNILATNVVIAGSTAITSAAYLAVAIIARGAANFVIEHAAESFRCSTALTKPVLKYVLVVTRTRN